MADGGPPAPQPPLTPSTHPAASPTPPAEPDTPPAQLGPVPQLNWSHFKLEFAGKTKMQKYIFSG